MRPDEAKLYGRGLAFGIGLSPDGTVASTSGPENIRQSLEIILSTEPGERIMRPNFGCGLREFVYEPNTAATHRLIEERVVRAVQRWEPRVRLESVVVRADPDDLRRAVADVRYRLVATGHGGALAVAVDVAQDTATAGGAA